MSRSAAVAASAVALSLLTGCATTGANSEPAYLALTEQHPFATTPHLTSETWKLFPDADYSTSGCDYSLRIGDCTAYVGEPMHSGEPWTLHSGHHCASVWLTYEDGLVRHFYLPRSVTPVALEIASRPKETECGAFLVIPAGE